MLLGVLKDLARQLISPAKGTVSTKIVTVGGLPNSAASTRKVLNVGGNTKDIPIPPEYVGWQHVLLDIDPRGNPDVVCDARALTSLPAAQFDAVYCSHNLEHYYRHDVARVLAGFRHVLKDDGFVQILVPDIGELIKRVADQALEMDAVLYISPAGPIQVHDVIYGLGVEIERSGNDFFAHKTGFTTKTLEACLQAAGFTKMFFSSGYLEIRVIAFKNAPSKFASDLLRLSA